MTAPRTIKKIPVGGYKSGSWFERTLRPDAPLDTNSAAKIANFKADMNGWMSLPDDSYGNKKQLSNCIVETSRADPLWTITAWDRNASKDTGYAPVWMSRDKQISAKPNSSNAYYPVNVANGVTVNGAVVGTFHAPADIAKMVADGGDHPMQLRNVDTGEELHTWLTVIDTTNRRISCSWGAYVPDITQFDGRFAYSLKLPDGSMNGWHDMKVSASGIPQSIVTLTIEDLLYGVHHPIGMAVPRLVQRQEVDPENPNFKRVKPCYPAAGSDGVVSETDANADNFLELGQMLTLRPSSDYSKKHWPVWMRNLVEGIINYGVLPTDTNGSGITLAGVCPNIYQEYLLAGANVYQTRITGPMTDSSGNPIQSNWCASFFSGGANDEAGRKYDAFPHEDWVALPVCRTADDYAKLTVADSVSNWDIVAALAADLPEIRADLHATIDHARAIAAIAKTASTSTGTATATLTPSTTSVADPA